MVEKGFEFTMWPDYPIEVQRYDPRGLCEFPTVFTYELGLSWHYTRRQLPPGYAYFMHIGPKTKNGDWTDLALKNPIALFVVGLGVITPIIGVSYCILLYMGYCGSPNSCERKFQLKWRFLLNIIMGISIITSMPGLFSAYLSIMSLMSVSLQVEELPSLDRLIQNSIEQITHIFTQNKEEMITQSKAIIESIIKTNIDLMKASDTEQRNNVMPEIMKPLDNIKKYADDKLLINDDIHAGLHLVRDVYRDWVRTYADHLVFTSDKAAFYKKVEFGDYPSRYLCPRMFYDYDESVRKLQELSAKLQERVDNIDEALNASMNEAYRIIEEFGENAIAAANDYYDELSDWGETVINGLNDIMEKSHNLGNQYDAKEISIPNSVINFSLVVCLIYSVLYITFILGMIVGLLGSRGPRDIFGFNKKTASKVLNAVIITSFGVYTLCALGSIRMYYYALVMEQGVCNMEAMPDDGTGGVTIFHSCKISDTVYKRMREWDLVPDYPFRRNILDSVKSSMYKTWSEKSGTFFKLDNIEENIIRQAINCDTLWPGRNFDEFKNDHASYVEVMRSRNPRQYLIPPSPSGNSDQLVFLHYNMVPCLTGFPNTLNKEVIPKYLQSFLLEWGLIFSNFSKDFPQGVADSIRQQFKLDSEAIRNFLKCPYLQIIAEAVDQDLRHALTKYEFWIRNALGVEIGKCGLLAEIIMRKVREACDCMLAPLDGSWTGLFWVFFSLPVTIAAAIALGNNYKKGSVDYTRTRFRWEL